MLAKISPLTYSSSFRRFRRLPGGSHLEPAALGERRRIEEAQGVAAVAHDQAGLDRGSGPSPRPEYLNDRAVRTIARRRRRRRPTATSAGRARLFQTVMPSPKCSGPPPLAVCSTSRSRAWSSDRRAAVQAGALVQDAVDVLNPLRERIAIVRIGVHEGVGVDRQGGSRRLPGSKPRRPPLEAMTIVAERAARVRTST